MALTQPKRLSYTRRDILSLDGDVDRYIKEFIPEIKDTSRANVGRLYLQLIEALVDNLNFSVDQAQIESLLEKARQRKNILRLSYLIGYAPKATSSASVDLTVSMLSGVAGPGGQSIPAFTVFQTTTTPVVEFFNPDAATILEGSTSVTVPAVQGVRVIDEILSSAADGSPNQVYTLGNARTPHEFLEVKVDGVVVSKKSDFADGNADEIIYKAEFDEDDFTNIIFGDGEFGKAPPAGSSITVTYVRSAGDDGNASVISRVIGTIASTVGVSNAESASGGAESETDASIKRNAPANRRAFERIVTLSDHESIADAITGVFSSFAKHNEGTRTDVYIMPEGGGVASSTLLNTVQEQFDLKKLEGAIPVAQALNQASVLISMNAVTFSTDIEKNLVKRKIRNAITDALDFTKIKPGRGFTRSDVAGIIENLDNGTLIDYVDFTILSRVPRVVKSNVSAPDFVGRVTISPTAGYDTWLVTALTTTTFSVTKNGTPQTTNGTVATSYTTDNSEITFTLGIPSDTLTVGDTWKFDTSKYVDNIVISENESMRLELDTDLAVAVFFPDEYNLKTKSAV